MNITVKVKNVYGVDRIYPVCDRAKLLLALTRRKSFSTSDTHLIKSLGYEIITEIPTI